MTEATLVVCARRDDGDWRDLVGCVQSLRLYSTLPVRAFWHGPCPPEIEAEPQPEHCHTFGCAYGHAVAQVEEGDVIIVNDDCRIHPNTVELLLEDVANLIRAEVNPGMVAAHSNFARKGQSLRTLPGRLPEHVPAVSPIFAWIGRAALDVIEWPDCNWYSDDIICVDLNTAGFTNWISRAYVDHFGERNSRQHGETQEDLKRDGLAWVKKHRPELLKEHP